MGNIIKGYKIDIPNVTGNIAITVRASDKSGSTTPVNGDVMGYLTYGKGINQTTAEIKDDAECWASVNLVPVTQGKTYTISCDATYAWVYSFDANGNYVSTLTTGDNKKPQNITFVADSPYIRFGCYDPNHTLTYCKITETSSSGGTDEPTEPSDPVNGDIMGYLTYGKGINQTTAEINDNPGCWASVNLVPVTQGKTYTISCDATYAWVYSFDANGNYVSTLTTGDNKKPQNITFVADSPYIRFGCYDPNHTLTYCKITETSSSGGTDEPTEPSDPVNGDIMGYLTYGKGINQTTAEINDNPGCWATVNSIEVEQGATYTLKMDATWAWVYSFDESGNFSSSLVLGNDKNPQEFTFKADTTKIKVGCYDLNNKLTYCTVTKVGATSPGDIMYTITNNLTNCINSNKSTSAYENSTYIAAITEKDGYELDNVNVVMGGTDITSTVVSDIPGGDIPGGSGVEVSKVYSISYDLSNCKSDNTASTVIFGNSYSTTIVMNSGYELMNISITMGENNVTSSAYTYQDGKAVINIPNVVGNVVIVAQATVSSTGGTIPEVTNYSITRRLTNCTSNNTSTNVPKGASYSTSITANSGYTLESVTVTMGGTDITSIAVSGNAIDIISVTGDIVIIAQATASSSGGDSPSNTINYLTYGKGINQTTAEINDNPGCWATVDPVTVVSGTTYTLKMDATWGWVFSYDDNGNFVSALSTGSSANPQSITFTANTTKIRYGCYDPNHTLTYCNLTNNDEVKIALNKISNMIVYKGQRFNILYSSNISAVKHEISWDGGITFWDKTSEILVENTVNYKYAHNADTEYDLFNMAIRVTDKNENTDVGYFTITFKDNEVEDNFVFTRYKRLNDGVLVDYTDESEASYYSTVNMNEVTAGASYTISINLCNYINVCYYDENGSYVTFSEAHTDDWSVKGFSTTITIPSNVKYIRVCATNNGTQVVGTLTKKVSTQDLLDSTGAYVIDDFSGTSVDENKWGYELGYVRNGESQRYTNSNAEINDGILALRALKDSDGNWTSSSIISKHHFAFMYGKIVARVKPCNYNGAFGAFWTLGDSFEFGYNEWGGPSDLSEWWPWCGEFDIMEFYNHHLTCGTFFGNRQESGRVWYDNYDTGAWHEFGMEWLENGTLIFTIDGNELSRTSPTDDRAFHIPHFILLNQAVGASGGTPDASTTEITQYVDWVKYYPASTENLVLNSSNFELVPGDFQDNHCILRLEFKDNCINKSVNWSSSNSDIISVHNGLCAAVGTGNAVITATSQSGTSKSITLHSDGSTVSVVNNAPTENPPTEGSDLLDSTGAYMVDDFTGSSVDRSKWDYELGYVRNGELQNYTSTNTEVNNSILALKGIKDSNGNWTASSIISKGHFAFMYGKIECRAKIDPTWGSFSAFWTLGDSFEFGYHDGASPDTLGEYWAYCGEFDVMEFYSGRLTCGAFFNGREESGRVWYSNYDFNAWHTFAMEWLEDGTLIFSIDGNELSRTSATNNRAFHIPHFILINQAIGASGGTPDGSTTAITQYVDWVKYYPASTSNLVLNSSDFSLQVTDPNDSAHNCMVRPIFNDNCINKSLTWSSSNPSLVWVHSGLCGTYAGANGIVTITATSHSGVSKSIRLTVTNGTIR